MAIDRATRWVFLQVYADQSESSSVDFLEQLHKAAPMKIVKQLTDNGSQFTDRFTSKARVPSGRHHFDVRCRALGITHRLTPPRHPQTNGMVERFNGRISELVRQTRFKSAQELDTTLTAYCKTYNHQIPQRALNQLTPIQALKHWSGKRPELFIKQVKNLPALDSLPMQLLLEKTMENSKKTGKLFKRLKFSFAAFGLFALTACQSDADKTANSGGAAFLEATTENSSRLLDQATFGITSQDLNKVKAMGIPAWVDDQLTIAATPYDVVPYFDGNYVITCQGNTDPFCYLNHYSTRLLQLNFYKNVLSAPDQLRQRVAMALGQIFSADEDGLPEYGAREYQEIFIDNAFGNYRDLLEKVTLSPYMGAFLNMVNNDKSAPNENYAREILQLFSIGTTKLNLDGTPVVDANGTAVPAYDPSVIHNFSLVFSGWAYPYTGNAPAWTASWGFFGQMMPYDDHHDQTAKTLLNGQKLPAGQTATKDLKDALDIIYNHPNVGPFVGKQLIKFLTTSNPSPAYVTRVAKVFNDNGKGVRGDLSAVVRAILLDVEARGNGASDDFGMLRNPVLMTTGLLRALNANTDGMGPTFALGGSGLDIFNPPSVFSFYSPTYPLPKSPGFVGPEFALQNTGTVLSRLNLVWGILNNYYGYVGGSTTVDLSPYQLLASDTSALVNRVNDLLVHGAMTDAEKAIVADAVNARAAGDLLGRAQTAIYLIATSPRYQVIH